MAEEKNISSETDDWLDEIEDTDVQDESGELAQSDIDALLGGGTDDSEMAAPEKSATAESGDELAQTDIDDLLGGGTDDSEMAAPEKSVTEEFGDELAQSDIDALLGGGTDDSEMAAPEKSVTEESGDELAQSDIDALLGGGTDDSEKAAPEESATAESGDELVHTDIDDLFKEGTAETKTGLADEDSGATSGEEDVSDLFADIGKDEKEDPFQAEKTGFDEIMDDAGGGDDQFKAGAGDEPDDFGFDFGGDEEATQVGEEKADLAELPEFETVPGLKDDKESGKKGFKMPFTVPESINSAISNKKMMSMIGAFLVLLIVVSAYFLKFRGPDQDAIILAEQEGVTETGEAPEQPEAVGEVVVPVENSIPVVIDGEYEMPQSGGEVAILLLGRDDDDDQLEFEITSKPEFGRLSGEAPELVFLPDNDFPGKDSFEFKASDAKDTSTTAMVVITGPDMRIKVAEKPKVLAPKKPMISAVDVTLRTLSTKDLTIDWKRVWSQANKTLFKSNVAVEIVNESRYGKLSKISKSKHRYRPDKYFSGMEILKYRFRQEGAKSKTKQIKLIIALGEPAPEINLKPLAEAYDVGSEVVLDVTPTRDDDRDSVRFVWQQVGGISQPFTAINNEGSAIAFIVPSSFYTVVYPDLVMRVTAIDKTGKEDSKDIRVPVNQSIKADRRSTALWRGVPGRDSLACEPDCPGGKCPGNLLPWQYMD
ncbi:MAG: Ig-like domain-containing protein [Thermodesulfobacteriota bacterium]|nr:Ig-like domain-containing protein [Thermodesulfobacteriota bacterium]